MKIDATTGGGSDRNGHLDAEVDAKIDDLLARLPPSDVTPEDFFAGQFSAGLAFVHQPPELGGCNARPQLQARVNERLRASGAKSAALRNPIGIGLAIPTLDQHATVEQKLAYFLAAFTTREIWCQLFSEPGAGSDLASLATRAIRDGAGWRVSGQKVWTSMAHLARRGLLLARTDPSKPKNKGLTVFVVDMLAPGVEVRPLRQMTGDTEFNEVFLSEVWIPDSDRIGAEGNGWKVATTTLMNERVIHSGDTGGFGTVGGSGIERLLERARQVGVTDPILRDRLVTLYIDNQVLRFTNLRARAARKAGVPGPEGSLSKLFQGLYNQRLQQAAVDLLGAGQIGWREDEQVATGAVHGFLRAQGNTLEGGTSEILRNIIAERVLGLPRDLGPAPSTPWSELRRNT